ncbi:hypothetical protein PsYK624_117750 [Phanerochaete sordida]|uniref:Uncharacterized protein n=1 Tax=Phanerochaete sordida TaxID=48140 RepID=A0A9P3LIE6_9APHY|nr:hypothetical protein PsYK624_117750 [Phanerochaete sordida]
MVWRSKSGHDEHEILCAGIAFRGVPRYGKLGRREQHGEPWVLGFMPANLRTFCFRHEDPARRIVLPSRPPPSMAGVASGPGVK